MEITESAHPLTVLTKFTCKNLGTASNLEYFIIWPLSGPIGAGLKKFSCIYVLY
jgi:hypothetical protein